MTTLNVPKREEVSESNQAIFDNLEKMVGFVPNLYALFAHSENALADCMTFQSRKSSLNMKEKEVINLVVSEVNNCHYCLSAHTAISKMNGFSDEQILEIRSGSASFDAKLDALAKFVKDITINRTIPTRSVVDNLFNAGYTKANIVDVVVAIGEKFMSNLINGVAETPIDFPEAPVLNEAVEA